MEVLATKLANLGYSIWHDQSQEQITMQGMVQGIRDTKVFLLFLTKDCLTRPCVATRGRSHARL